MLLKTRTILIKYLIKGYKNLQIPGFLLLLLLLLLLLVKCPWRLLIMVLRRLR
jgi:hypothetical protein